ncbi:P-type conjugative transfer protein TrbG [Mesorhizobium sp.]|uniref:P-type conjugative transfer protein TrbG n=1 Tax=Mesorhizobium sp. TaxID=1871066 RepID=UPI000FEA58FC|nr:P-type conjugative transfer protein TrbG [Mesorhizobium sp.]TGQ66246.1 P-type conjugative transfer protein TrbG [bacterium M00.F.Ca.ET.205.01.1.1]TGU49641.1 P-type conjugative transfer protein TrbG [bacterium M00.F.Ca.ET.152.01.1.1]TGV33738.1 P-type conjugative transfer protein TrbG [Mesorhizobium sp. M00.F.Ca.ET.186.01.1.1]TGZ40643.1 P-type conjugative transfer protein TrbG [bacterium M00.F.Ca.ET.162.01.1.1]RWA62001.1 MAG: P-type conjugative transfer protein TrbG [Mesorhizobium sp.]
MTNRAPSFRAALVLSPSAAVLSACGSKPVPPPENSYDAADFKPAAVEKSPEKPVKIVEVPKPLPLPGQLQPEPGKAVEDKRSPEDRVADANKAATQQPTKYGYVNAVQVYGALYQLYAAPERVSDIALQPGEKLTAVSAGDTVRWVIGDTVSGTGDNQRTHVLVKPFAPGLSTNLVITTERRTYHLQLQSTEKTAMAAISWTYSEDQIIALRQRNAQAEAAMPVTSNVALENIRFRYSITGDTPAWRPTRAFDDGSKVYIEFPRRIDQGEAPPLFIVGADGNNQLVNYRMRGNYYIVDRLFAAAELRLGTKQQQVVLITRTDGRQPLRRIPLFARSSR